MTVTVVPYRPKVVADPDPYLIEQLETMLQKAKDGEIIGMAAAFLDMSNEPFTVKGGTHNTATLGALQLLGHHIAAALLLAYPDKIDG